MIARPQDAVDKGWIVLSPYSKVQQSGIDVSIKMIRHIVWENGRLERWELVLPAILNANSIYEFTCYEYIKVPKNHIALLIVRSTWNRQGAFVTTGIYDNGFQNYIGGMLRTALPMRLDPNERIAQVIFMESRAVAQYGGRYQGK